MKKQARVPRSPAKRTPAARSPRVPTIESQLKTHFSALKKGPYGVTGIGLGLRRRNGRLTPETVVRVIVPIKPARVAGKPRRLPPGVKKLPRTLPFTTRILGQVVRLRVPVDVEQLPTFVPTLFRVGTDPPGPAGIASAYAVWSTDDQKRLGVISTSHTLAPDDQGIVKVEVPDPGAPEGKAWIEGHVLLQSNLSQTGFDVALVEVTDFDPSDLAIFDAGPRAAPIASRADLIRLLGTANDGVATRAVFWRTNTPEFHAVAYYDTYPAPLEGGGTLLLRSVVESQGKPNTFVHGLSGSTWSGSHHNEFRILAIQSYSRKQTFDRSVGTSMTAAVDWIKLRTGFADLALAWNRAEVRALLNAP